MMQVMNPDISSNTQPPESTAGSSLLVLIVKDEEAIVTLLDYNLRSAGYQTAVARDGEEAVDLARTLEPNAILLDWIGLPPKK